jgi:hypothetical protein
MKITMEERFTDFTAKRMLIFNELVKRYWKGQLNTAADLENLAQEIRSQFGFDANEMPFIKDHIRIAMGLDPKEGTTFDDALEFVKKSGKVTSPVIARMKAHVNIAKRNPVCVQSMKPKYTAEAMNLLLKITSA